MDRITEPLLTIAIPTYNRAKYLDRCLLHIGNQLIDNKNIIDQIDIIVSDNASIDNTYDIVNKYIQQGIKIRYFKNEINEGPDFNILQCYKEAKGKFVLVLGDDDILINNAISKILFVIFKEKNIGVIHLKAEGFVNDYIKYSRAYSKKGYIKYDNSVNFINKITYLITFISSNIINKDFIDLNKLSIYKGTDIMHVSALLVAIIKSSKNIYVNEILLAAQIDNSGGYNYFKIFTHNLYKIHNEIAGESVADIVMKSIIKEHFPYCIVKYKENKLNNYTIDISYLSELGLKYKSYWIFNYPILIFPTFFAKIYFIGVKVYNKVNREIENLKQSAIRLENYSNKDY